MRILVLVILLWLLPASVARADEMDDLGARFNAAIEARDYETAKTVATQMIALGEAQGFDPDTFLFPMRLTLVRLQIDTGERLPVLPGYASLYADMIERDTLNLDTLATIADEWVGISTDWDLETQLEAQLADKSTGYGPVLVRLATAYRRSFDFTDADRIMQRGLDALVQAPTILVVAAAQVQNNFAWRTMLRYGMFAEAQAEMQVALSLIAPVRDRPEASDLLTHIVHNLAEATLELGERPTALQLALAGMSERTRLLGPNDPKVAELAVLASRASDKLGEEFNLLMQAIEIYNADAAVRGNVYDLLIRRADLLRRAGKLTEAKADIDQAFDAYGVANALEDMQAPRDALFNRQIARILGTRSAIRATLGGSEGAYIDSLMSEKFYEYADGSGGPVPKDPNLIAEWQARTSIDAIYQKIDTSKRALDKGDPMFAMESAYRAVALASTKLVVGRRYHDLLGGRYQEGRNNFRRYKDIADQYLAAEAKLPDTADRIDWLHKSFDVFGDLTLSSTSSAIEMVEERETAKAGEGATMRRYFDTVGEVRALQDNWLRSVIPSILKPGATLEPEPFGFARRYSALVGETQHLTDSLPDWYSQADTSLGEPNPYELGDLLRSNEVLIGLYCNETDSTAWAIRKTGLSMVRIEANCAGIRARVDALRASAGVGDVRGPTKIGEYDQTQAARVVANAYEAYQTLFAPLEFDIQDATRILFVPTGDFIGVPWSMLVTQEPDPEATDPFASARWLARDYAVDIVPSLSAFRLLREQGTRPRAPQPYLGVGNPLLGTASADTAPAVQEINDFFRGGTADLASLRQLPELPETATEITSVAATLGADASEQLIGAAATEAALKSLGDAGALRNYRVLHFATHGLVAGDLDGLVEPALVLSLPTAASSVDDGLLTASEISTLDLNADWAVLSACNTAAGASANAEPLTGLARAFLYAGARSLLVSQWPVESKSAVELITSTFKHAGAMEQIDRAEALRLAMVELIDSGTNDPALWAPFFVIGD